MICSGGRDVLPTREQYEVASVHNNTSIDRCIRVSKELSNTILPAVDRGLPWKTSDHLRTIGRAVLAHAPQNKVHTFQSCNNYTSHRISSLENGESYGEVNT